ncbi:MAG: V-type ATPase subunit [Candidatus Anstonellales archaeon]
MLEFLREGGSRISSLVEAALSPINRPLKYGYSNARVSGMKGYLLKPEFYDELVNADTIDGMIELLQRTYYKEYLVSLSISYKGSELIELAGGKHFGDMASRIKRIAPRSDLEVVDVFLKRWVLTNYKTVFSGRMVGKSWKEIEPYIIPVGRIEEYRKVGESSDAYNAFKATSIGREIFALGMGKFGKEKEGILTEAAKRGDVLMQVFVLIDLYYYQYVHEIASKILPADAYGILMFLRREIDVKNISAVLRLRERKMENVAEYLVPGGTVRVNDLVDAYKDDRTLLRLLSRFDIKEIKKPEEAEMEMETWLAKRKSIIFHKSMLNIGKVLGFLLLKEEEGNNIRKIARAHEFGLSKEEIRKMVV